MSLPDDAPCPRLCHLIKWPDFNGYGFNLHAEKSKQGQYIGKVDDDSPAMLAGLQEGDKIIEVNFVNICNENHRQVVERIKSITNETRLLVIDDYGDRWYRERKIVIKSSQPNVIFYRTPVPRPAIGTLPLPSSPDSFLQHRSSSSNSNHHHNGIPKSMDHNINDQVNQKQRNSELNRRTSSSASSNISTGAGSNSDNHSNNNTSITSNNSINNNHSKINGDNSLANNNIDDSLSTSSSNHSSLNRKHNHNNNVNDNDINIIAKLNINDEVAPPVAPVNEVNTSSTATTVQDKINLVTANGTTANNNNNTNGTAVQVSTTKSSSPSLNKSPSSSTSSNTTTNDNSTGGGTGELNLNMTAAEMRQLIAQRKKQDVKKTNIDLRKKYEIIQQM